MEMNAIYTIVLTHNSTPNKSQRAVNFRIKVLTQHSIIQLTSTHIQMMMHVIALQKPFTIILYVPAHHAQI